MNIKNVIKRLNDRWNLIYCFYSDYKFYKQHNCDSAYSKQDKLSARIMLVMHQLEKGMSFTNSKREFGGDKAMHLVTMLRKYISKYGMNDVGRTAVNVLYEYSKRDNSTHNPKVRKAIDEICKEYKLEIKDGFAGVKQVSEPPVFNRQEIESFFKSRSSVREYSDAPVTEKEYQSAKAFASCTPSACNRQASRVHYYNTKDTIKRLIDNQLGNQGWCDYAQACFVVTVNECYFGGGTNGMKPLLMADCTQ